MTNQIFNADGIANVRDLKEEIQAQYQGCGRGYVVISTEGEVVALTYNGHIPKDKVAEFEAIVKAYKEAGHEFFSCNYSSGQILLDKQDVRKTLLEREDYNNERPMGEPSNSCFTEFNQFGIPAEFIVNPYEVYERYPCSNGGYNYPDGLYFSNDCQGGRFEMVVTFDVED